MGKSCMTPKQTAQAALDIARLYSQGKDKKEIANELKIDLGFVVYVIKSRNLKKPVLPMITFADSTTMNRESRRKAKKNGNIMIPNFAAKQLEPKEEVKDMTVEEKLVPELVTNEVVEPEITTITDTEIISDTVAEEVVPTRKKRVSLTTKQVKEIKYLLDNGETYKSISEAYDVSTSTIARIKNGTLKGKTMKRRKKKSYNNRSRNNITTENTIVEEVVSTNIVETPSSVDNIILNTSDVENTEISTVVEEVTSSIEVNDFNELFGLSLIPGLKEVKAMRYIEAGLVVDRHDMPVNKFVFTNCLTEELMFNYEDQERICRDFINRNFTFTNNVANEMLILYVTGIQCALGSIIKVCNQMNVTLVLKHYNAKEKRYQMQKIFCDDNISIDDSISNVIRYIDRRMSHDIMFYRCNASDFTGADDRFYLITLAKVSSDETSSERGAIIVKNFSDIWDVYPTIIKQINYNTKEKLAVFVTDSNIEDGKFNYGNHITKGYNFK